MTDEDLKKVAELFDKEREYRLKKDVDNLLALYTDDAVMIGPNREVVEGKAGVKKLIEYYSSTYEETLVNAVPIDVVGMGDALASRYIYVAKNKLRGHEAIEHSGRGVVVFKRTPKGLLIHWDVWNYPPAF